MWRYRNNETFVHICDLNNVEFEEIFGENLMKMKKVYNNFKTNYENKGKLTEISPQDPFCDPLSLLFEYSNGNKVS